MDLALREQILQTADRPVFKTDPVPVWWFPVFIRTISARERIWLNARSSNGVVEFIDLVVVGLGDAEGNRLFEDDDIDLVSDKNPEAIEFIGREVMRHNRLGVKAQREAEKNSETIPSSSGS